MKTNLLNIGQSKGRLYSHALISMALFLGMSLPGNGEKEPTKTTGNDEPHQITWDVNAYKIKSQSVLTLALTNTLGTGKTQLLTGCYSSGNISLYEQGAKGLKELRSIGKIDGSITDIKLMSMGGSLNKAVVAHEEKGTLRIYDLKSDAPPMTLFHGAHGINNVEIADIDGDGLGDIIPISYNGKTNVWFQNDRHHGFTKRHLPASKRKVSAINVVDFDQDGDQDILLASDHDKMISLFRNDGFGNFTESAIEDGIKGVLDIAIVDMDMDGTLDVAYVSHAEKTVQLLLNKESGFDRKKVSTRLNSLNNIKVFDLGNDGRPDLIISSFDDNAIRIIENAESGLREHQLQATIPSPTDLAIKTDVDNGKTVIYVSSMAKNKVYAIDLEIAD